MDDERSGFFICPLSSPREKTMFDRAFAFALAAVAAGVVAALTPADAAAQGKPVETMIEAKGPNGPLAATMLAPTPGAPVVLIVPGSGPTDRDGNNPIGVRASTYRLLAEGLAARAIATVRIDKRGLFGSRAAIANPNAVTIGDYAADVRTWVSVIRERTGASCVWVLGHSEGGLVALAAAQDMPDLCGLILVSAAGRPFGALLREQLRSNPANAPILDQALSIIARLEAGQRVDAGEMNPVLLPLFAPAVQDFLISEFSFDPAKLIAACRAPILILQGERDLQIGVGDAKLLAQASPAAKLVLLPDANHVLKTVTSDDRNANIATYANPSLPLANGVTDAIADFIAAAAKAR
jgi:pimeloyl-ACP methyl ester carboxylesterase